ncbi:CDGSH iron-sulfur domain-containing protein [Breznakiella homolactica]|uniref:CDGSH iron-sulfur domain-containing protein n=1 Tax=Breznakiella homolactica TaxID=2798577 RepID=A0A7T7XLD4_9SPIR|nr:CDGSH iron-sulfur domain-containing protein [Breznakiella homolactica]QQO08549.1 CDGSH iron-sulfur domain-containing protein [Breznakiella homolactica]
MNSNQEIRIKILPGGPYEVTGTVPLKQAIIVADKHGHSEKWGEGKKYEIKEESFHLCRCGHSKNKPFCSGEHKNIGFTGDETAGFSTYEDRASVLEGEALDLMDDETLCAVARFCDRGGNVWRLTMASGVEENAEAAVYEASCCPAGRLTSVKKDGTRLEPKLEKEIGIVEDTARNCKGPIWVKGGIEIESASGQSYEVRNRVTLCRCGESSNMPYCDAHHLQCSHMQGLDK